MDAAASAAARAAASLPSSASWPPCETGDSGASVTTSLATAASSSAVSDESGAPTTSLGLTWSDTDAPMVVDDEAAPYNGNSAATRGEDSTNGGRHGVDEDASASRPSPEGDVPAAEFDRSEGDVDSSIMTCRQQ